jgi:predicted MFS family arabinose efflux permease
MSATARVNTRAWGAVLLLMLVGILNIVDRFLPSILVEPIKRDLLLSDTAVGLINGFGFLVIYAVLGIPIARVSDRGSYGVVISVCITVWSLMTGLAGFVQTGWQLALTRMGVATGEAGSSPAAHAFISRNFRPERRGAPLAVLTLSVPVASLVSLIAGGLLGEALGWRNTFILMGAIGLVLALAVALLLGTRQSAASGTAASASSFGPALQLLQKRSFVAILAASGCIGIGGYSLTTFGPAFLMRVHGMSMGDVGVQYGIATGGGGIVAVILTGIIADRMSTRDPRWILRVVAIMIALLLPFSYAALFVPNHWLAVPFLALATVIATAYLAPVVAAIQRLVPTELRATASAVLLFFTALSGGAGPLITGMISDALHPQLGAHALGRAMLVVPLAHTLAAILYLTATRGFRRDMVVADE